MPIVRRLLISGLLGAVATWPFTAPVVASPEDDAYSVASRTFHDQLYATSVTQLMRFLQQYPNSSSVPEARRMLGRAYFALGQYPEALVELKQSLGPQGSPKTAEILYWLGEALLKNRDYEAAREHFQQILDQFPVSSYAPFALYSIGWSYWEASRWEEALTHFQRTVQRYPDDPLRIESQFRAGECLVRLNRPDEAAAVLQEFVGGYPVTKYAPQAYYLLGEALIAQRQLAAAVAAYQKAIGVAQHGPWAPLAQSGIGLAYFTMKQYGPSADALSLFLERYPRGPQHDQVRFYLARALIELGKPSEAVDHLTRLADQMPDSPWADDALLWHGQLWYQQGRMAEAAAAFRQLLERYPASDLVPDATYALAWAQLKLGDVEAARHTFELAATRGTNLNQRASALAQAGDLLMQTRAYEEAAHRYDQVLQDFDGSPYADYAEYQLGQSLLALGRLDSARLAYDALLSRFPNSRLKPRALYQAGLVELQAGQPAAAIPRLEAVLKIDESPATLKQEARYQLGSAFSRTGQADAALKIFRDLVRTVPPQEDLYRLAHYQLGWALYRAGKIPESLKQFHEYLSTYPTSEMTPELAVWLAQYYYHHGQTGQALQLLTTVSAQLGQHPALPDLQFWTGRILLSLGERQKGLATLEDILRTHPDHPDALESVTALAEAYQHEPDQAPLTTLLHALSQNGRHPTLQRAAWESLGSLAKMQGQYDQAIAYFRNAVGPSVTETTAGFQYQLASCYDAAGQFDSAVSEYLKVAYLTSRGPWPTKAQLRSAELLEQLGRQQDAVRLYERAAQQGGDTEPAAHEQLERLRRQLTTTP